jgi:hypothetical protein
MTSLIGLVESIEKEIKLSEECMHNILARLDEDIARINERKLQIIDEFNARRAALEEMIGGTAPKADETKEGGSDAGNNDGE